MKLGNVIVIMIKKNLGFVFVKYCKVVVIMMKIV